MMSNLETDLQKTVMPLIYGFSWLQEVILLSKITKVSNMDDSFENDAVIFLHNSFSVIQVMGLNDEKSWNRLQKDCNAINLFFIATSSDSVQ